MLSKAGWNKSIDKQIKHSKSAIYALLDKFIDGHTIPIGIHTDWYVRLGADTRLPSLESNRVFEL